MDTRGYILSSGTQVVSGSKKLPG